MNVQLLSLFQSKSQVLVEMRVPRQQVAALVGVSAAGGSGLHGWRGGGADAECGGRRPCRVRLPSLPSWGKPRHSNTEQS